MNFSYRVVINLPKNYVSSITYLIPSHWDRIYLNYTKYIIRRIVCNRCALEMKMMQDRSYNNAEATAIKKKENKKGKSIYLLPSFIFLKSWLSTIVTLWCMWFFLRSARSMLYELKRPYAAIINRLWKIR